MRFSHIPFIVMVASLSFSANRCDLPDLEALLREHALKDERQGDRPVLARPAPQHEDRGRPGTPRSMRPVEDVPRDVHDLAR